MTLKEWNYMQCKAFECLNINDCVQVYRYASLIAKYREQENNTETYDKIVAEIKQLLEIKG